MTRRDICILGLALTWLVVTPSNDSKAAPPATDARPAIEAKVAELVDLAGHGHPDAMLERIGPPAEPERAAFVETRDALINLYGDSGKYSGFDIAGYKVLTPRFQVAYVVVYFEKRPVLFELGFYKMDDTWRAQTFRWQSDFKGILDTMPLQK